MDKSFVTLEQKQCMVCGELYDTGTIIMDGRLRDLFDHHTFTGRGMCQTCMDKLKYESIALVEVGNEGTDIRIQPNEAKIGNRAFIVKRSLFEQLFDVPLEDYPMMFIDKPVADHLEKAVHAMKEAENAEASS